MALTNAQLAAGFNASLADPAQHVDGETVRRWLKRGLARPADGEHLSAWATRAREWRAASRKTSGPKPRGAAGSEIDREELLKLRAERRIKEAQAEEIEGRVHSKKECHDLQLGRYQQMANAFAGYGRALKSRVQLLTPDEVEQILDDEVRRRLEMVAPRDAAEGGSSVDPGAA